MRNFVQSGKCPKSGRDELPLYANANMKLRRGCKCEVAKQNLMQKQMQICEIQSFGFVNTSYHPTL
jgi:hypothetical protein